MENPLARWRISRMPCLITRGQSDQSGEQDFGNDWLVVDLVLVNQSWHDDPQLRFLQGVATCCDH